MKEQLLYLWQRRLAGEATAEENARLDELLANENNEPAVQEALSALYDSTDLSGDFFSAEQKDAMFSAIMTGPKRIAPVHRVHFMRRGWFRYAAAAVILFAVGSLWFVVDRRSSDKPPVVQTPIDIAPGHDGAILTLADGKQVVLDSMGNGVVAKQSGSTITLNTGKLEYEKSAIGSQGSAITYNTLQTPRGRQFQLVLPDGSKVWLNAASSITYPTVFAGNERKVKTTGEVYFEVLKDRSKPFVVDADGKQTLEVLGTHFNINSYADEDAIRTTLLEGKVKVSFTQPETSNPSAAEGLPQAKPKPETILKPEQQSQLTAGKLTTTNNVDIAQIMAWKNGTFSFRDADLPAVMRQLARWYNVDVEYRGAIPKDRFDGDIGNTLTLDQVLKGLAKTRIHYQIENGNKLIILP